MPWASWVLSFPADGSGSPFDNVEPLIPMRETTCSFVGDHDVFLHHDEFTVLDETRLRRERDSNLEHGIVHDVERRRLLNIEADPVADSLRPLQRRLPNRLELPVADPGDVTRPHS